MAFVFLIIALFSFVPSYWDMYSGTFPIHWTAHIHGALMKGWLLVFWIQAMLAVNNRIKIHRQLGQYALLLGVLIWISMGSSSFRAIIGYDPPVGHYLFDVLLIQLSSMNPFALFFIWGILKRKNAIVHKRLLFLATLILMSAAINRIQWLPEFFPSIIYLNSFLLLLFLLDEYKKLPGQAHSSLYCYKSLLLFLLAYLSCTSSGLIFLISSGNQLMERY